MLPCNHDQQAIGKCQYESVGGGLTRRSCRSLCLPDKSYEAGHFVCGEGRHINLFVLSPLLCLHSRHGSCTSTQQTQPSGLLILMSSPRRSSRHPQDRRNQQRSASETRRRETLARRRHLLSGARYLYATSRAQGWTKYCLGSYAGAGNNAM